MSGILGILAGSSAVPGILNQSLPSGSAADPATAVFGLGNAGTYNIGTLGAEESTGDWVVPSETDIAALYQVKFDMTSGGLAAGSDATATWLDLSTGRAWLINAASGGGVGFDISFREKATQLLRHTQTGLTLIIT